MKYAIVLPDGAADVPLPQLGGKTPLQAARIPHLDRVAASGRLGRYVTVPDGFTPATDVGTLSVLGYDPHLDYTGRAPIEAAAKGLAVRALDRLDLVVVHVEAVDDTAHPAKFPEEIQTLPGIYPGLPPSLAGLESRPEQYGHLTTEYAPFRDLLRERFPGA